MSNRSGAVHSACKKPPHENTLLLRALIGLAAGALLLFTFRLYTHPNFMLKLANQFWLCF